MMKKHDLLRKTELKIEKIFLQNANLTDLAARTAEILGLEQNEVLVVDYRDASLNLDILNTCVNAYHIVGKKQQLLDGLDKLPGVFVSAETSVFSDGMLGWIAMDQEPAVRALRRSEQMASEILKNISRRVMVFSTGTEVAGGQIEDTNTPTIAQHFSDAGYKVTMGETLKDDRLFIAAKLREAAEYGGFGLIVTTGGVGAEDKDHTVEAIIDLDSDAATPYICHFQAGTGRHVKDGVKIAVGHYNDTLIVALPGPNDEVKASLGILAEGLEDGLDQHVLAENLAGNLREMLRKKIAHRHV
jgi:molybdenum cofactor synthesis domain-containing protein